MAKKESDVESIVSKLIGNKDEIQVRIQERIRLGKELLAIKITVTSVNNYTKPPYVKYDEKGQSEFFSTFIKWNNYNSDLLKHAFNNPDNEYKDEYDSTEYFSGMGVSMDVISDQKKTIQRKIDMLESFIERLEMIPTDKIQPQNSVTVPKSVNKIFIVHGHNEVMKEKVARTLLKLGLNPIILHERPDGGKTIIEKIEKNSSEVGFAVVLLTDDDEGKAKIETTYKSRARQNVIFEMGYFIGALGRDRVFLLLAKGVEKPGDLDGIVYTPFDENDGWKLKLVKELKVAGYSVSADQL